MQAFPGDSCPKTGTWTPAGNPNFYPKEYADLVMKREFSQGEPMPETPHGEPYWILATDSVEGETAPDIGKPKPPMRDFTNLTPERILQALRQRKAV